LPKMREKKCPILRSYEALWTRSLFTDRENEEKPPSIRDLERKMRRSLLNETLI